MTPQRLRFADGLGDCRLRWLLRAISIDTIRDAARSIYDVAVRTPLVPLGAARRPAVPRSISSSKRSSRSARSRSAAPTTPSAACRPAQLARGRLDRQRRQRRAGRRARGAQGRRRAAASWSWTRRPRPSCAPSTASAPRSSRRPTTSAGARSRRTRPIAMTGHFVHPFDDDDFISGNGTAGLEIVEDLPDVDAVIAPVGGGGLLAGIGVALRALRPDARVYAAEPETAAPLQRSFDARRRPAASTNGQPSFVDGAGGKSVLDTMWPLLREYVHESIVVSLDDAARGDAAGRRARARDRRRGRRPAPSPPRSRRRWRRAATRRSSPSSPAATSISRSSRSSSARARTVLNPMPDPSLTMNLPERINRLPELATDLWWTWNPQAREVFRRLDYPLWRQTAHNPVLMLRNVSPELLEAAAQRRTLPRPSTTPRSRRSTRARRARHVVAAPLRRQPGTDRLLLGGVRAAPVAADLRRRPRRARRRSLQGSQRPRRAAHRRRLHVSAGLLPPERLARRLAAGIVRAPELGRRADRARRDRRRQAVHRRRCRSATAACSCRCGACGSGA